MKYIYIIVIVLLTSCTTGQKQKTLKELSNSQVELKSEILSCDSTIWSPFINCSFDDKIVTRIHSIDNIFYLYQWNNNNKIKMIGGFGKKGNGPKEFQSAADCYYDDKGKVLYIFSKINNIIKSYKVNLTSTDNLFSSEKWEIIDLKCTRQDSYFWGNIVPINDSLYIGVGGSYEKNNMLSEINLKTNKISDIIPYPNDNVEVPTLIKQSIYTQGSLLKRSGKNQYLYCCNNWGNYAEVITLNETNKLVQRKIIANDFPIYSIAPDGINLKSADNCLMGMSAYVTEQYIYLLPNFLKKKEYLNKTKNDGYPPDYCDVVYKFNWDGDFIQSYKLEKSILNFIVDPADQYIVGCSIDLKNGENVFVRYSLR